VTAQDSDAASDAAPDAGAAVVPILVGTAQPPANVSVTPSTGSGIQQTFQFTVASPNGYGDIGTIWVILNSTSTVNAVNGCYVSYDTASTWVAIANDQNTAWKEWRLPGRRPYPLQQPVQRQSGGVLGGGVGERSHLESGLKFHFRVCRAPKYLGG
jgi:hypothetical protein